MIALCVGWCLLVGVTVISACLAGCGSTANVSATASCSALLIAIGESRVEPVRAEADRQIVTEVCTRYAAEGSAP